MRFVLSPLAPMLVNILSLSSLATIASASAIAAEVAADVSSVCDGIPDWRNDPMNSINIHISNEFGRKNNGYLDVLNDTDCTTSQMSTCLSTHQRALVWSTLQAVFPFILCIIMVLMYFLCFVPCACCRCCRRCPCFCCCRESKEPMNFGKSKRLVIGIWTVLFLAAFSICAIFAILSDYQLHSGAQGAYCEVFSLADNILNGYNATDDGEGSWVGLLPLESSLQNVADSVSPTGSFSVGVSEALNSTDIIETHMVELLGYLSLMKDMLGMESNRISGTYECKLCTEFFTGSDAPVDQLIATINSSAPASLYQLRNLVRTQLNGTALASVYDTLSGAVEPVTDMTTLVSDSIGKIFVDNKSLGLQILYDIRVVVLAISLAVVIPGLLLLNTTFCGAFCSKRSTYRDPRIKPRNPCHASCSWCLTCYYSFAILFLSAIILLLAYVLTTGCVVFQDLENRIDELTSRLPGTQDVTANLMTACLPLGSSGDFADYIMIGDQTLAEALDIGGAINDQFSVINDAFNGTEPQNITALPTYMEFMNLLENFGSLFTITYTLEDLQDAFPSDSSALTDDQKAQLYELMLKSTPNCQNTTASIGSGDSFDSVIANLFEVPVNTSLSFSGIEAYLAALTSDSLSPSPSACTSNSIDLSSLSLSSETSIWGDMLKLVEAPLANNFTCHRGSLSQDENGNYFFNRTTAYCTYSEWIDYVSWLQGEIQNSAETLDLDVSPSSPTNVVSALNSTLRSLVDETFVTPVNTVLNGINCNVVSIRFNSFLDALCDVAVPGLVGIGVAWVALGLIAWLVIFMEFNIWRRLKDNYCLWNDEINRGRH